ncbi:MAG: copper-binding protein [Opitutus sp.]|nr:copper-binding protein [Opitutus sp.]
MKSLRSLLLVLALIPFTRAGEHAESLNCGCTCCEGKEVCCCHADDAPAAAPVRHPLKGVIKDVRREHSALLVKHEEIPGVMKAMTMLLKVDAATLDAAQKGQAITAQLEQRDGDFWLVDVQPAR